MFGVMRFLTGLGVGALVATTGALVAEIAPPGKKNLCNAITYSGVPIGSLLAALAAIILVDSIGWRGMFLIGALPIVTLLPLAFFKMPESVSWLVARGQVDKARAISERTGVPMPDAPTAAQKAAEPEKVGFAGLFSRGYWLPTVLMGFMSATGLVLVYSLNTWLPVLMEKSGFNAKGSLSFLLVLNGGAILGALAGSRFADRFGPKPVVASCFLIGAVSIALLTVSLPLALLLIFVAIVGLGTSGTQTLIYGFVANYYPTRDARRRGGLVRRIRSTRRCRRSTAGRLPDRGGTGRQLDLLRAGRGRRSRPDPVPAGAERQPSHRHPLHAHRADGTDRTPEPQNPAS